MAKSYVSRYGAIEEHADLSKNKPKRPLSAYNIFYRLCRESLYSSSFSHHKNDDYVGAVFGHIFSMDHEILLKKSIEIQKNYRTKQPGKHLKIEGKGFCKQLGFQELTRVIATQWGKLKPSKREIFKKCSEIDRTIYLEIRNRWKIQKDEKIKQRLEEQDQIHKDFDQTLSSENIDGKTDYNHECSFHALSSNCIDSNYAQTQHDFKLKPPPTTPSLLIEGYSVTSDKKSISELMPSSFISRTNQITQLNNQIDVFEDENNVRSTGRSDQMYTSDMWLNLINLRESQGERDELTRQILINYALRGDPEVDQILIRNGHSPFIRDSLLSLFLQTLYF